MYTCTVYGYVRVNWDVISAVDCTAGLQLSPLYFGSIGRSNFYGMLVDTVWATISMAVVIQMRGQVRVEACFLCGHRLPLP